MPALSRFVGVAAATFGFDGIELGDALVQRSKNIEMQVQFAQSSSLKMASDVRHQFRPVELVSCWIRSDIKIFVVDVDF